MGLPADAETDYAQPVSALLRQGTAAAHTRAENSEGAAWLLRGELDRAEYVRFLMMLWHVYKCVSCTASAPPC
jgi:heme oxygenase